MSESPNNKTIPYISSALAALLMTLGLFLQGRVVWCKLGDYRVYANEAWNSGHTSQHFLDPYSLTHVLHGVLFFWITGLIFKDILVHWRFLAAVVLESAWELFENTTYVIEKYRANTISLDYFGDSIMNSLGDLASCSIGFWIAVKLGILRSLVFFVLVELVLIAWIRDSLLINIIMLLYPLETIKLWQSGI